MSRPTIRTDEDRTEVKIEGELKIGKYTISAVGIGGDKPWIFGEGGEGMATTPEKLFKLIDDFYREEL